MMRPELALVTAANSMPAMTPLKPYEPERRFYQGLLQIAVACHHLSRGNLRGAILLLGEGRSALQTVAA